MTFLAKLNERLDAGEIVSMPVAQWKRVTKGFPLVEAIETSMAGRILLVRREAADGKSGWSLVEEPTPDERVIRPLANEKEARALIADRLAAYERMWDG